MVWLALIIVIVIIFVGYRLWAVIEVKRETNNLDLSQWKICRNDEFGFEFKYPADWSVMNVGHPRERRQVDCNEILQVPGYALNGSSGSITLRLKNADNQDIWRENLQGVNSLDDYFATQNREPQRVTALDGEKLSRQCLGVHVFPCWFAHPGDQGRLLITYHNGNIYEFITSVRLVVLNQILSTFRFIE